MSIETEKRTGIDINPQDFPLRPTIESSSHEIDSLDQYKREIRSRRLPTKEHKKYGARIFTAKLALYGLFLLQERGSVEEDQRTEVERTLHEGRFLLSEFNHAINKNGTVQDVQHGEKVSADIYLEQEAKYKSWLLMKEESNPEQLTSFVASQIKKARRGTDAFNSMVVGTWGW